MGLLKEKRIWQKWFNFHANMKMHRLRVNKLIVCTPNFWSSQESIHSCLLNLWIWIQFNINSRMMNVSVAVLWASAVVSELEKYTFPLKRFSYLKDFPFIKHLSNVNVFLLWRCKMKLHWFDRLLKHEINKFDRQKSSALIMSVYGK